MKDMFKKTLDKLSNLFAKIFSIRTAKTAATVIFKLGVLAIGLWAAYRLFQFAKGGWHGLVPNEEAAFTIAAVLSLSLLFFYHLARKGNLVGWLFAPILLIFVAIEGGMSGCLRVNDEGGARHEELATSAKKDTGIDERADARATVTAMTSEVDDLQRSIGEAKAEANLIATMAPEDVTNLRRKLIQFQSIQARMDEEAKTGKGEKYLQAESAMTALAMKEGLTIKAIEELLTSNNAKLANIANLQKEAAGAEAMLTSKQTRLTEANADLASMGVEVAASTEALATIVKTRHYVFAKADQWSAQTPFTAQDIVFCMWFVLFAALHIAVSHSIAWAMDFRGVLSGKAQAQISEGLVEKAFSEYKHQGEPEMPENMLAFPEMRAEEDIDKRLRKKDAVRDVARFCASEGLFDDQYQSKELDRISLPRRRQMILDKRLDILKFFLDRNDLEAIAKSQEAVSSNARTAA